MNVFIVNLGGLRLVLSKLAIVGVVQTAQLHLDV